MCALGRPEMPSSFSRAPRPFAGGDQRRREQRAESDADAGAEQALLDREAHQEDAAERERKPADPDRPLGAEPLLQAHLRPRRCRAWRRRNRRGGGDRRRGLRLRRAGRRLWTGLGEGGRRALRFGDRRDRRRQRSRRLRRPDARGRRGERALQVSEPHLDAAHLIAERDGLDQCDDGDDRDRDQQQPEQIRGIPSNPTRQSRHAIEAGQPAKASIRENCRAPGCRRAIARMQHAAPPTRSAAWRAPARSARSRPVAAWSACPHRRAAARCRAPG